MARPSPDEAPEEDRPFPVAVEEMLAPFEAPPRGICTVGRCFAMERPAESSAEEDAA